MVIATVLPEVKDLSLKAQVICTKFIYVKFYLSSIFWPWSFKQMKTARKKVSLKCKSENKQTNKINKMQSDLVTSLRSLVPAYLAFLPASPTIPS